MFLNIFSQHDALFKIPVGPAKISRIDFRSRLEINAYSWKFQSYPGSERNVAILIYVMVHMYHSLNRDGGCIFRILKNF